MGRSQFKKTFVFKRHDVMWAQVSIIRRPWSIRFLWHYLGCFERQDSQEFSRTFQAQFPEVGDSSHMTWLELASSRKFEDLRLAWLTLTKDLTWHWLGINDLRLDLDLRQMTRKDSTFYDLFSITYLHFLHYALKHDWGIFGAVRANLATWRTQQRQGRRQPTYSSYT